MNAKDKAKELVNKYLSTGMIIRQAKQCALIAVDYILASHSGFEDSAWYNSKLNFYTEVKQEINKL